MIFAASSAYAQTSSSYLKLTPVYNLKYTGIPQSTVPVTGIISPSFYSSCLGFFCKQELKLQNTTGIPFKFRLGSVQYVDYLEGKHGAALRP